MKQIFLVPFTVWTIHYDGLNHPGFPRSLILWSKAKIQTNDKVEGNLVTNNRSNDGLFANTTDWIRTIFLQSGRRKAEVCAINDISVFVFTQCIQSLNFLYLFCQYSPKVIGKKWEQPEYHWRGEIEDRDFNCLTKKNMQSFSLASENSRRSFSFFPNLETIQNDVRKDM